MNESLKAFKDGFIQGVRETPRGFFAPVLALCHWLNRVTDDAMRGKGRKDERRPIIHSEPDQRMEPSTVDSNAERSKDTWHATLTHLLERITVLEQRQDELDRVMRSAREVQGPDDSAIDEKE
ncbi:hypothetical protein [Rhodanobacter sp. MP7CTX1]|jgi:hypothetical protein|uniref:hypothetical protein n=1 Tax=Rhodanobacter sp. MP7CTX1 TaxID=2723084 RepID=UPI0016181226|nr:hypothetical protein [Rhodanobacter sp. MP7CTX1]MBB6188978.1 hypothetical protein [Rhodanobacter sp. MP7CTX1]